MGHYCKDFLSLLLYSCSRCFWTRFSFLEIYWKAKQGFLTFTDGLVDGGSSIELVPWRMVKKLWLTVNKLMKVFGAVFGNGTKEFIAHNGEFVISTVLNLW